MVEITKFNLNVKDDNNRFVCADCRVLPFPDNYFDVIICIGVLFYVEDEISVFNELKRIGKKNCSIIFSFPNALRLRNMLDPYYYLNTLQKFLKAKIYSKILSRNAAVNISNSRQIFLQKRYTLGEVKKIIHKAKLPNVEMKGFAYGPIRFWRKEILPLNHIISISNFFEKLQSIKIFSFLNYFSAQWVFYSKFDE